MSWRHWQLLARLGSGWLLAALLLATLAPAVSRTLSNAPATGGHGWVEICTAQGMQRVRAQDPEAAAEAEAAIAGLLDLCGHCTLAAERFAPLIPERPKLPLIGGSAPAPVWTTISSAEAPVLVAQARGPPLLS